jgi:CubicO group peptidase (beta-lactamase class C family)
VSRTRATTMLLALVALFGAGGSWADAPWNADRIRSWADAYFTKALADRGINGAVLTVVQDGEPIVLSGYGFEDISAGKAIDPQSSEFEIASNTKIFTTMALLQLLDEGRIADLNDPVNRYLRRFHLPRVDDRDITLLQLLTHRAGLGEGRFHEMTSGAEAAPATGLQYRSLLAGFTNTPGVVSSYTNSGAAILGAVVEDVTGQRYADYVAQHILLPLGMLHTSIVTTGPRPAGMARPVRYFPDGSQERVVLFGINPLFAPSSAIVSTAADMARFIAAQADEGKTSPNPLLKTATFARMHRQQVSNDPMLNGLGLQYLTSMSRGEPVASHSGSLPGFTTAQAVFPGLNAAVFVALSADEGVRGRWWEFALAQLLPTRMRRDLGKPFEPPLDAEDALNALRAEILGLPQEQPSAAEAAPEQVRAADFAGTYVTDRRPVGSMLKFSPVTSRIFHVSSGKRPNEIMINGDGYRAVAPDVFQAIAGPRRLAFSRDSRGKVQRLVGWISSATRVDLLDNPGFAMMVILVGLLLALTAPVIAIRPVHRRLEHVGRAACALLPVSAAMILWTLFFSADMQRGIMGLSDAIDIGETRPLWLIQISSDVFALAVVVMIASVPIAWCARWWGADRLAGLRRAHLSVVAASAGAALLFLLRFHVLGFHPLPEPWPDSLSSDGRSGGYIAETPR